MIRSPASYAPQTCPSAIVDIGLGANAGTARRFVDLSAVLGISQRLALAAARARARLARRLRVEVVARDFDKVSRDELEVVFGFGFA